MLTHGELKVRFLNRSEKDLSSDICFYLSSFYGFLFIKYLKKLSRYPKIEQTPLNPKSFRSIPAVSKATRISLRAVRNAYHSKGTSIRKASGEVYTLKWYSPMAPMDTSKCYHCHKALTVKNRSAWFDMEREDIKGAPMTFTSLYMASKVTGISNNALRNACEKNNKKIT